MRIVFAIFVAVLAAIESFVLALLFISLLVPLGGSGEFTGITQFVSTIYAVYFLPLPTFVVVFMLVLTYHRPENHRAFRSLAWGLVVAVAIFAIGLTLTESPGLGTPWYLILNAVVLAFWITITLWWRRRVLDEGGSF